MATAWNWPNLLIGLGLFLFGMSLLEKGLQGLSERNFKQFLRKHTATTFGGILSGAAVTAILQSSSLVSLMVLSLVGAGVISFRNAIGVVWGANLGTTITGWLFVVIGFKLKLLPFASVCIFLGALAALVFEHKKKVFHLSRFLFSFGLLILGLSLMKDTMGQLSQNFKLSDYANFGPYLFFPIGILLTAVIQSSSATLVLTLSAVNSQFISFPQAMAVIIGAEIGTTITIFAGAIKGTVAKKRVAWSHLAFNIFLACVFLPFLHPISSFLTRSFAQGHLLYAIVGLHSFMNFTGIVLLSGWQYRFASWLERMLPNHKKRYAKYIHEVSPDYPEIVSEALKNEARQLIFNVIGLSLRGFGLNTRPESWPQAIIPKNGTDYHGQYTELKHIEGEVIDFYLKLSHEEQLDFADSPIETYVESIKKSLSSAKHLKDIQHNLNQFLNSARDHVYHFLLEIRQTNLDLYEYILEVIENGASSDQSTSLEAAFDKNRIDNDSLVNKVYQLLENKEIKKVEASTFLLVLREIYSSNKGLLLALRDVKSFD